MESSEAIEEVIRKKVKKLERAFDHITGVRVVVDVPNHSKHKGQTFSVQVDVKIPGKEIAVHKGSSQHGAQEDVYVALRDAFEAVTKQMKTKFSKMRNDVKHHEKREEVSEEFE